MQPTEPKEDVVEVDPHAKASKERDHQEASKNEVVTNPEVIDNYGPWMLAGKPPRRRPRKKPGKENFIQH